MKTEVMELIKELGFNIKSTSAVYGVEDARVTAENEGWTIRTSVAGSFLEVAILSSATSTEAAAFLFVKGALPDLRFREYTPELLELARRFGAVAGFDI